MILYPFYGVFSLLALAGGFLIDIDHYLYYVIHSGSLGIKKAYDFCFSGGKNYLTIFCVFHNIEFLLAMAMIGFFYNDFYPLAAGILLHFIMDMVYMYMGGRLKNEIRAWSIVARMLSQE